MSQMLTVLKFFCAFIFLVFFVEKIEAQTEVLYSSLVELEQNIYQKQFSKRWAKLKQADWEAKCKGAKTVEEYNVLFNEYSDLLAQTSSFSLGNSYATNEVEFAQYLLSVDSVIPSDLIKSWDLEEKEAWRSRLNTFISDKESKLMELALMEQTNFLNGVLEDFEYRFSEIFEDSKKNSFKNVDTFIIQWPPIYPTDFIGGSGETIRSDEYGIKSFTVFFDARDNIETALVMLGKMTKTIEELVPEGYEKINETDTQFLDRTKFVFRYEGEKFNETAKQPTVTIGIHNNPIGIQMIITEPIFGH